MTTDEEHIDNVADAARKVGRREERARIVAWLRDERVWEFMAGAGFVTADVPAAFRLAADELEAQRDTP